MTEVLLTCPELYKSFIGEVYQKLGFHDENSVLTPPNLKVFTFTTLKKLSFFFFLVIFFPYFVDIFTNNLALAMFDSLVELGMKPQFATAHRVDLIFSSPVFLKRKALLNLSSLLALAQLNLTEKHAF